MAAPAKTSGTRATRGRRTARASGDDRERAILETAEQLLEGRSLSELSVDDLARGAGISRPTFYFYFPSKDAVLLTLVDRMAEEARRRRASARDELPEDPRDRWRQSLELSYEIFGSRRAVILAAAELRASNAEARALWAEITDGWVADVTDVIEAERARGAAPQGTPARDLATALVLMNERVLHATFAQEVPSVADDGVIDVLLDVWLSAIYGTSTPA